MILGLGIDLIEIARVQKSIDRFGNHFIDRVFLPTEIEYCKKMKSPARHYAARFAAKEAVAKAFGTGIGPLIGWKDIEIRCHESGQPYLVFHGKGAKLAESRAVRGSCISVTHHESTAASVAVLHSFNPSESVKT